MAIKQVSIFVENECGKMAEVLDILKKNGINMSALSLADTASFGILRLIVNNPEKAVASLKAEGIMVKTTNVIAAAMDDRPGGLAELLDVLKEAQVSIEYTYAFIGERKGAAVMVMKVDDEEAAIKALNAKGVSILEAKDVHIDN